MGQDSSKEGSGFFGRMHGPHGVAQLSAGRLVAWGDHLKLDHAIIDAQHEAIFKLAARVYEIWRRHDSLDELKEALARFGNLIEGHFRSEEQILRQIEYPKLAEHAAEHRAMLDEHARLTERIARMEDKRCFPDPGWMVMSYTLGVTIGHILSSDLEYYHSLHRRDREEPDFGLETVS